jgi:pyruvate-formate lyase-activating enzyme
LEDTSLTTDKQSTRLLARTFFNQLRSSGYTPTQIIGMATELLDLVTEDLKGADKTVAQATAEARPDFRQEA